jgi:hypothetical protein
MHIPLYAVLLPKAFTETMRMPEVTLGHFKRAAADIGAHGDNDTLPFDVDNRFIAANQDALAEVAFNYFRELEARGAENAASSINSLQVFSERLLTPTGPAGFRITTKLHPFWNIYFNGLGIAIAEAHEPERSERAHSYRFAPQGDGLFDRAASWRAYREATIADNDLQKDGAVVVQTDISSFYEHIYHHRIKNCVADLFRQGSTVPTQIDRFLSKFASGRSFGLPVGGQCARILAELLMSSADRMLSDAGVIWHRYVDDFTLITSSQADAYRALSALSHALADYGLSLNRTKTIVLAAKHYIDYARSQLGTPEDEASKLREIDLHFDPYSDTADSDYEELRETVEKLEVQALLNLELQKGQPDAFLVAQIGRTLKLHAPRVALQLCATLLDSKNLHAFRASWSTIMRGIASVRADEAYSEIFDPLDQLLDAIPEHSPHLLLPEANCLHFLRTIRFRRTQTRAEYVFNTVYSSTTSETVKRACIECWRHWKDRPSFIRMRNKWNSLGAEEQRMLWLAAVEFGDDGSNFRKQVRKTLASAWRLGIERNGKPTFESIYTRWASNGT